MIQIPQNLCSEITDEQASTVQGGKKLRIESITAIKAGSDPANFLGVGKSADDLYAVIDGEKVNIGQFNTGDSKQVNIVREVGSEAIVRFWDRDLGSDDPVGSMHITKNIEDEYLEVFGPSKDNQRSRYAIKYSFGSS